MIQEIKIDNIATYTNPVSIHPLYLNFFYGSNGSGKTTLSNFLGGYGAFPTSCSISWENDAPLKVLCYNKNFVKSNFGESSTLNGIFTLGKDSTDAQVFIADHRKKVGDCNELIAKQLRSKKTLIAQMETEDNRIDEDCWKIKLKYGDRFEKALTGFRKSKTVFRNKCLTEYPKMDETNPPILKDIEGLYAVAFGKDGVIYPNIEEIEIASILQIEDFPLLNKRISGSSETPIGKFIEFLNSSDWMKQGIGYAGKADGKCPYCQQSLPETTQKDIEAFFDATYEKECSAVHDFKNRYNSFMDKLLSRLREIPEISIAFANLDLFLAELDVLASIIDANKKIIQEKINSPATLMKIESIVPVLQRINATIKTYNAEINSNNNIVQNQGTERTHCINLIWELLTYELRTHIKQYKINREGKTIGINNVQKIIDEQTKKIVEYERLIAEKEEDLTSVTPTVNAINTILKGFGFDNFEIAENPEQKGTYKIIRQDGTNAKTTLSEGEYNFITFLYFYHLVYGSHDKTGIALNKVVVIDDPISSLDSNVLFIISTLARTILTDCIDKKNGIQQVFILTHNIYFHKEITFLGSRKEYPKLRTTFWILKKFDNISQCIRYASNPIQTSYELLWSELKEPGASKRVTIYNTLRRILEYYFNIIGGMNYETCIEKFDGDDKIICKALISSINDGSHSIYDDFAMCCDDNTAENYIRVFKDIFEKMEHGSHYNMMMRESTKVPVVGTIDTDI